MADESLRNPPPRPPQPTRLRTHAALVQFFVPLVSSTGEPAGLSEFEVNLLNLTGTTLTDFTDFVRRAAIIAGKI